MSRAGKKETFPRIVRLKVLAAGGWPQALGRVGRLWREQGAAGLRRGLAVLAAQAELSPEEGGFAADDYAEWIRRYDGLDAAGRRRLRRRAGRLAGPAPLSLILLPGEGGGFDFLKNSLDSLAGQVYGRWELLAPEAGLDAETRRILERRAAADRRIRLVSTPEGAGRAAVLAAALAAVRGPYCGFLHAGDKLAEYALFCAAKALHDAPDTLVLYGDEDRLNDRGVRYAPWFKPDRNPELMFAQDMFSGLCLLHTDAAAAAGGPRPEFGRWMVYDLVWRILDAAAAEGRPGPVLRHVPRVLCHRRGRPAAETAAGLRAGQEHLDRRGGGRAEPAPDVPGCLRIAYAPPGPEARTSILIPTRDRADLLSACVRSIWERTERGNLEIVVIDNGSREEAALRLLDALEKRGARIVRDAGPFNFSRLNNAAAAAATGGFLCLMNNDVEVTHGGWLDEMLSFAARPDVGCVGARLLYPDGTLQHGGILRGVAGFAGHAHLGLPAGKTGYFGRAALEQEVSAVTGACLVIRRAVFEAVGGLDESLPESYNDVDMCLRVAAAGYRNVWTPYAELVHRESASRRNRTPRDPAAMTRQERNTTQLMRTRWGALAEDPAYNPNLTRRSCGFGLAWPPRVAPPALL